MNRKVKPLKSATLTDFFYWRPRRNVSFFCHCAPRKCFYRRLRLELVYARFDNAQRELIFLLQQLHLLRGLPHFHPPSVKLHLRHKRTHGQTPGIEFGGAF